MLKIFLIAVLTSASAFASSPDIESYIKVQEALASDDFKLAVNAHSNLCQKDSKLLATTYKDCSKTFKNIEELRGSFKVLSEVYLKELPLSKLKGLNRASCPMAKGRWIQKAGPLKNPYYGKTMLECGEKI